MATATTGMTAEEFYDWANRPENAGRWCELDRGRIVDVPPPGETHGIVCGLIAQFLTLFVRKRRKGYFTTNDSGLVVARGPDTVRGPDFMFFDRKLVLKDCRSGYTVDVPTLVIEVLSPTDRPHAVSRKVGQYLKRGVPLVWVIDPDVLSISVHRPGQEAMVLDETDELSGYDVLPELNLTVADLFRAPDEGLEMS